MNIFVLDEDPITAAQMMASALRRHGATDENFIALGILTKAGKPYKGGYAHHPCTVWAGDTHPNFSWLAIHGIGLISEYKKRFGKEHACTRPIIRMEGLGRVLILKPSDDILEHITGGVRTPFEYRPNHIPLSTGKAGQQQKGDSHASGDEAVQAYRAYYHAKTFARWDKIPSRQPDWWMGVTA